MEDQIEWTDFHVAANPQPVPGQGQVMGGYSQQPQKPGVYSQQAQRPGGNPQQLGAHSLQGLQGPGAYHQYPQQPQWSNPAPYLQGQQPQEVYHPPQQQPQAPPPYQPLHPNQQTQSAAAPVYVQKQQTTVIMQQPLIANDEVDHSNCQTGAVIFAVLSSILILIMGCWWALPCTIAGIALGFMDGNAKKSFKTSVGCSIAGWVSAIMGLVVYVIILVAVFTTII